MIGGANGSNVGIPGPTLKTLIEGKDVTHVIIQYRGIKFKCKLGGNICIIGSIKPNGCIVLYYNFVYNCANISSFFYYKSKVDCIGPAKAINNTNFINNNNKTTTRQKKLHKLFLTLIDIININLKIKMCGVGDAAFIMIGQNSISLLYKHMERGYGFYNEFGYLYIPVGYEESEFSSNLYNNIEIDKRVTYANECLEYLNTFSTQNITKVTDIYKTSVNNNSLSENLSIYNTDNMSIIRDMYQKTDKKESLLQSLLDSEEYIKSKTFREYITLIIKKLQEGIPQTISLLHIQDIILKCFMDPHFNIQKLDYIKYYKYDDKNKIFTTELNTKIDKQANQANQANNKEIKYTLPYKFVLQEHEQQTITITKNTSEENKDDNIIFDITIVPH